MSLRLAILGDVHDERARLGTVLRSLASFRPELTVIAGDVGQDPPWLEPARHAGRGPHDESVRWVLDEVRGALGCPVVFVPGNHDLPDVAPDLDAFNLDRRILEVQGLRLAGLGGAGPAAFGFPYEWTEQQADDALATLFSGARPDLDIFVSHTPPANTRLDETLRHQHVGSRAVSDWIERLRPRMFVCGHIHEAPGLEQVHGVPCLNAGSLGEPYGRELAWVVQWEGGPARIEAVTRRS